MLITLRDYQEKAIDAVFKRYRDKPKGSAILYHCTGAGKTVTSSELVRQFLETGLAKKVLFIVHREELASQTVKKMMLVLGKNILNDIGIVKAELNQLGRKITVASIQTLLSNKRLLQVHENGPYDLIVQDECHHLTNNLWEKAANSFDGFKLGLTATPNELDQSLDDSIVHRYTIFDAIKDRNLVDIKGIKCKVDIGIDKLKVKDGDFIEKQILTEMIRPEVLDFTVESYLKHATDRTTVAFCVNVEHAKLLREKFVEKNISAEIVIGETPVNERNIIYDNFEKGITKVLLTVNVLTEGWDCTKADCCLFVRPTLSETLYIQAIGRVLRLHPGKKNALVLDMVGNSEKHRLMQLGVLFGRKPKNQKKAVEKIKELGLEEQIEEIEEDEIESVAKLISADEDFSLQSISTERKFAWIEFENSFYLSLGSAKYGFIVIKKEANSSFNMYNIYRYYANGWKDKIDTLCEDIPLDWAISISEKEVQGLIPESKTILVNKDSSWRDAPISEKQIKMLNEYNVKSIPKTKGEASQMISELLLIKQALEYSLKASETNEGNEALGKLRDWYKKQQLIIVNPNEVDLKLISTSEAKRLVVFNEYKLRNNK